MALSRARRAPAGLAMYTLRLLGSASLEGSGGPVAGRAGLRQRVAMLALLAVEHPHPLTRDKLLAYLWPDSGTDDARHQLRDSLYILRSALGDDFVLGTGDDLRLNPDRLSSDLWEFDAALARDDSEAAVAVYRGPFLDGFHLSDAEEFEHWIESERERLARRYRQALEQLAEREMQDGNPVRAIDWWSRLAQEDPYNSRIALRYMQALERAGDRAGALRHASLHSELLRTELGAVPEGDVVALADRLRSESRVAAGEKPVSLPASPAAESSQPTGRRWVRSKVLMVAVVVGLAVLGGTLLRAHPAALAPRRVAVAVFENHTGRPELEDLGPMTADWIVRGLMETPLIDVTDLETVYAGEGNSVAERIEPRALARRNGAGLVISGNYYRSGDSVLFQAGIMNVESGRVLRSFAPVGAPIANIAGALGALREQIAGGLGALVNPANPIFPVDPDLIPPPNFAAYREFVAGLREGKLGDWDAESQHYRKSAELDSTFAAPLVQWAYRATWIDQCQLTDSIGGVLDTRRERLTAWDRFTIDLLRARCRGDMASAVQLMGQRFEAYPRSFIAARQYASALQHSNQLRAARKVLGQLHPDVDSHGRWWTPDAARGAYWAFVADTHHMLAEYTAEIDITDRWRDSSSADWLVTRGRALSGLGQEREVLELVRGMLGRSIDSVAGSMLAVATELAAHGHARTAMVVAESVVTRLELVHGADSVPREQIAWASRLLGRKEQEIAALAEIARTDPDTLAMLEARARIAVLQADTAEAERIDKILAEQSSRPLRTPTVRAAQIVARAHIAAGFGRRDEAVALLRSANARGILPSGPSHAFHTDLLLTPLRGYPPFEALLKPDN